MWNEVLLAVVWSVGGPLEKRVLHERSADAYATTKALVVSAGYLLSRRPIDVSIMRSPLAWILCLLSIVNTPLYARIVKQRDPSLVLPFVSTLSSVLRLGWMRFDPNVDPLTVKQWMGIVLVLLGGALVS